MAVQLALESCFYSHQIIHDHHHYSTLFRDNKQFWTLANVFLIYDMCISLLRPDSVIKGIKGKHPIQMVKLHNEASHYEDV